MKRILLIALALISGVCSAQTFKVQNLAVLGTSTFTGPASFTAGPTAPTAAVGTNTTQLATTQFVAKHAPCASILDYGGNNGGSVDNLAAWAAVIAASPANQACIFFPAGIYAFSGNASYLFPGGFGSIGSITIIGAGADLTYLKWAAGGGMTLTEVSNLDSFHIRDMTFLSGVANAPNAAIQITQTQASVTNPADSAQSDITNVTIRGSDNYQATFYWGTGIDINGSSYINFNGLYIAGDSTHTNGIGVNIHGAALVIPVVFNFNLSTFNSLNAGIIYGQYVQGVTVNQCNFTTGVNGISAPVAPAGLDQLVVTGSQFGALSGNGIVENGAIPNTQIIGNLFIVPSGANGINLITSNLFSIIGNAFASNNPGSITNNGITVQSTINSEGGIISGNVLTGMGNFAIQLTATSNHVNVQSNFYSGNGTNVGNAGISNTIGGGSQ